MITEEEQVARKDQALAKLTSVDHGAIEDPAGNRLTRESIGFALADTLDHAYSNCNRIEEMIGESSGSVDPVVVTNVQNNQSAILEQMLTMRQEINALSSAVGTQQIDTDAPGTPLEVNNPFGPDPRPQAMHNYTEFSLHDYGASAGGQGYQSTFSISTLISGIYSYKITGWHVGVSEGFIEELIQLREENNGWFYFSRPRRTYITPGGGEDKWAIEGQVVLKAGIDYRLVCFGDNVLHLETDMQAKSGFEIEYDFVLQSQLLNPDIDNPATWGTEHGYTQPTGSATSLGDPIYNMEIYRDNASTTFYVQGQMLTAGRQYRVRQFHGASESGAVYKIGINTDDDVYAETTEIMTMLRQDGSTVWDFDSENTEIDPDNADYIRHTFTADVSGEIVFEYSPASASETLRIARPIVEDITP